MPPPSSPPSRPPGIPATAGLLAVLAGAAVGILAFRGQPPFDNLSQRFHLSPPWDDLVHPLMLAAQVCFLGVLLLATAEILRLRALRGRVTRLNEGGWAQRFYRDCAADLPADYTPADFQQSVARRCDALEQAVVWRWRVPFILSALMCWAGLVVSWRALNVNPQPRLQPVDYFLPLWLTSVEALGVVAIVYLGVRGQWSRLLAELTEYGQRLATGTVTAPRETGRSPETRRGDGAVRLRHAEG